MSDHHRSDHRHGDHHPADDRHDHDLGLVHDLPRLLGGHVLGRRRLLGLVAGAGLVTLAGCAAPTAVAGSGAAAGSGAVAEIPEETAGPFPGDGSNGPNVLTESGIVRGDIRSSFGSRSGTADGVPLTITLTLVDAATGAPRPGAALYLWHCDRDGHYSLYDVADQNYLRGVQEADAAGRVTFTTIFPAAYSGRWPHAHFEVYPDLAAATDPDHAVVTSQLALPPDVCADVYATAGYASSAANLARTSLERDMVFRDGYATQLATVTGDVSGGYTATLTVGTD